MTEKVLTDDRLTLEIIREREEQIRAIQQDMITVREIFDQMSTLVDSQGPQLVHISQNITTTEQKVNDGVEELQKAYNNRPLCQIL